MKLLLTALLTLSSHAVTITSKVPGNNWEQAMVSGNGNQGIMVPGKPQKETLVINHTKLWVPAQSVTPDVPDLSPHIPRARKLAMEGDLKGAAGIYYHKFGEGNAANFPKEDLRRDGPRFDLNYVHPAAYLKIDDGGKGTPRDYSRTCNFDTGEVTTTWIDDSGTHRRQIFCDRVNDLTVIRLTRPDGKFIYGSIQLAERPGSNPKDISPPVIKHTSKTATLSAKYLHRWGRDHHDGYRTHLRIFSDGKMTPSGGKIISQGAKEILILLRTDYLDNVDQPEPLPTFIDVTHDYDSLLAAHAKIHREMFRRVTLDLGGQLGAGRSTEEIIAEAEQNGPTPAYLELIHASGRYCLISSSGDLPPTLMGIWGDSWKPMWWGHYTLDSNLQLAVSNGNVGNLPEAMDSFFTWIESLYPSWERNAKHLHASRGYMGAIAHGWRHGIAIAGWQEWTGCAPWMATFFWQHYLFTGDQKFLAERALPLLENVALFYQDFLKDMEQPDGKFLVFPSVSPENTPANFSKTAPNSSSELALIRETFNALITAYETLGIKQDRIPALQAFLAKVPDYRINDDGALAEWSHPGIQDNYNHRHNSHLIALYPGVSITPDTPDLYQAAKTAIAMRLKAGQGNKSAHGYMELGFAGARLQSPQIVWDMLDDYAREKFINTAFISSHNPNHRIYNLDSILALPAIFTEMCLYSFNGELNLLPGIPEDQLPKGSIKGILARTGIVIDELSWDLPAKKITLTLTSKTDQSVKLTSRLPWVKERSLILKSGQQQTFVIQ
ncbi:MAG: glycosyl hydrolase family 95 catalytic domain-containing protein [Verrucomicrobiaceae bacterium]